MTDAPKFFSNHLQWPVEKTTRRFRVHVVEPETYDPPEHVAIFNATLNTLLVPHVKLVDDLSSQWSVTTPDAFDLVTFPEAFLPADALIEALSSVSGLGSFGCIHVGLRPDTGKNHLFLTSQIALLVKKLAETPNLESLDLQPFSDWLAMQKVGDKFNLGCVFALDAHGRMRVCLHPKLVRSKYEANPLPENHMKEADLLTLVTLAPTDKTFLNVTLQPLTCSDALNLATDRKLGSPMQAIDRFAGTFGDTAPDHVDVVSVSTCTPQVETSFKGGSYRSWHQEFQNSFVSAASDDSFARHHFAAIILANFRTIPKTDPKMNPESDPGGLSGIFLPISPRKSFPSSMTVSAWGRPKKTKNSNRWSTPEDGDLSGWSGLGYIAALDPSARLSDTRVRILGATILRLPRDASPWKPSEGLEDCSVQIGDLTGGSLQFSNWESSDGS